MKMSRESGRIGLRGEADIIKKVDLRMNESRRINIRHRLVYEVREAEQAVVVARMWTYYE